MESFFINDKHYKPCCWSCDGLTRKQLLANGLSPFTVPSVFIVCPQCANKRCPKAQFHGFKCTGSNDVGQVGECEQNPTL